MERVDRPLLDGGGGGGFVGHPGGYGAAPLLVANTPTGGDMGAHVLGPAYLRDVLLPGGRIMGWSNHWFAGFPIFYFYFPLPSLVIVGLDLLLPYGVAFKIVSVLGLVALAPATYFLVRSMAFARPVAAIAAAAGGAYAFMETPTPNIFGGTIASTLAVSSPTRGHSRSRSCTSDVCYGPYTTTASTSLLRHWP